MLDSNQAFLESLRVGLGLSDGQINELTRLYPAPKGEEITKQVSDHMQNQNVIDLVLDPLNYAW